VGTPDPCPARAVPRAPSLARRHRPHDRPVSRLPPSALTVREQVRGGEQPLPGLCVLRRDSADGTVLRRLQDLFLGVPGGVDGFRLAVVVEGGNARGEGGAHRIADTDGVVDPGTPRSSPGPPLYFRAPGAP